MYNYFTASNAGCLCKNLVVEGGYGNCKKYSSIAKGKICYVTQPSSCPDLGDSEIIDSEKYSAAACKKGILYQINISQHKNIP